MLIHLGEVLIHLLVVFIIIKSLQLHLELVLLRSQRRKLLHRKLELLLQAVPLEYHILQVEHWLDGTPGCQAVVCQVNYVGGLLITAGFLLLYLLFNCVLVTLLLYQ